MKFIEVIKKYKTYILGVLLIIFFFRSCNKSTQSRKSDNVITEKMMTIDSLQKVTITQERIISGFFEVLRKEKIKVHSRYDNYISKKDRGDQLMELHMIVKENLKDLEDAK